MATLEEIILRPRVGDRPFMVPACSDLYRDRIRQILASEQLDILWKSLPSIKRAKYEYTLSVVRQCGGNISDAARRLGEHRRTVERILEKRAPRR
jgi:ActR/RegA family two-component response regulator